MDRKDDQAKPVRISASKVAAVCGYNPFSDPHELLLEAVYQDFDVMAQDTASGIQLISEEEQVCPRSLPFSYALRHPSQCILGDVAALQSW